MGIRFSTLFTAQYSIELLSTEEGILKALKWCRDTRVERVYIESFRSGVTVPRDHLITLRDRFAHEGFEVSGCVTPTKLGKVSTGYQLVSCYTNASTRQQLQDIFEYTASVFDVIMIDDFLFTDCECEECNEAKGSSSWSQYRCDLMMELSRVNILEASRKINPEVKIILKFPQWYDQLHERGYDTINQTEEYDLIWAGTETRDYNDSKWGGTPQYEAYFNMRWMKALGGKKTGGGWFDPYGTTEVTYLEQAIQTVLGGADEVFLFNYGSLLKDTGPANVELLRKEQEALKKLAVLIEGKDIRGIDAPKIPNSDAGKEYFIYSFIGMLGIPLTHGCCLDKDAPGAFLPVQAGKDPDIKEYIKYMNAESRPLLITQGLVEKVGDLDMTGNDNITVLDTAAGPSSLLEIDTEKLNLLRKPLLASLGIEFTAPNKVALYLFGNDTEVIENFNDHEIHVMLAIPQRLQPDKRNAVLVIPGSSHITLESEAAGIYSVVIPPRTMVLLNPGDKA